MPPISDEVHIKAVLKRGLMLKIQGDMPFESNYFHHFVVLNTNPLSNEIIILVHASHQVARIIEQSLIRGITDPSTICVIPPGKYDFFPEQTAFDCNNPHRITLDQLISIKQKNNMQMPYHNLDSEDLDKLTKGVLASRQVPEVIKKIIRP